VVVDGWWMGWWMDGLVDGWGVDGVCALGEAIVALYFTFALLCFALLCFALFITVLD